MGAADNVYWVGLELNPSGDGWAWLADGSALTEAQARWVAYMSLLFFMIVFEIIYRFTLKLTHIQTSGRLRD